MFDLENDPFEEVNLYDSEESEHVAAKEALYAKLDEYAANAFEVTNDFSANRASFQVWRAHDNWMVPYAKSSDFDDSKGGSYPHDDTEESCFEDSRRVLSDASSGGLGGSQQLTGAREERRNTEVHHTKRVISKVIEAHTTRRLGPPETAGFAAAAFDSRVANPRSSNLRRTV